MIKWRSVPFRSLPFPSVPFRSLPFPVAVAFAAITSVCSSQDAHAQPSVKAQTPRFLVVHDPTDPDQEGDIHDAIDAAKAVNGIVEFEAGKVYRTSQIKLWRDSGASDSGDLMVVGIEGNGAMLKWPTDAVPAGGQSLLYLWAPQYKANSGCYIRNLTLDCGNNDIPTAATAGGAGNGLEGTGGTGQLESGDEACAYGLRIFGGEDFLIENVTVMRAATYGIYVQTTTTYAVRNCVFRQVMSRFNDGDGIRFANTSGSGTQIENVTLENCYSHLNNGKGFHFERAENIRLVGCGAEKNNDTNVHVSSTVEGFKWLGGYTEKANYNHVSPPEDNYKPTPEQLAAVLNLNSAYYEIPEYFKYRSGMSVYGTTCSTKAAWKTALAGKLNIYLVLHGTGDQTTAINTAITAAINAPGSYSGILAFEPGQTYETKPITVEGNLGDAGDVDTTRGSVVGILGNGATLWGTSGGTQSDALLTIDKCFISQDVENDYHGFFLNGLNLNADLKYDTGLKITFSKYFYIRGVDITRARKRGVYLNAVKDSAFRDIYYGMLDRVNSHHNGEDATSLDARGIDIAGSDQGGVRLANVGIYRSSSNRNTTHGIYLEKASVTIADSDILGNADYGFRAGVMRSASLVNCRIAGRYDASIEVYLMPSTDTYEDENNGGATTNGWAGGFHFLGGHIRDRYNRDPDDGTVDYDDMNAPDGLIQSMLHTKNFSSLSSSLRAYITEAVADNDTTSGNSITVEGTGS